MSGIAVCVSSNTGATGEPQLRHYEGCGDPCFAVVIRNLAVTLDTNVTIAYSLDGKPQTPIAVGTGRTTVTPLDGMHNCVYGYHAPGTPSPCEDGVSAPADLAASPGRAKIRLTWSRSFAFGESRVAGYEIWRSKTGEPDTFTAIGTTTNLSFVDANLGSKKTYWYHVVAFDSEGLKSGPCEPVSATTK